MGTHRAIYLLIVTAAAVCWDLKEGKIPNLLLLAGAVTGLLTGSPAEWLMGMFLPFAGAFMLFRLRMCGAGDGKLLAVCGGILGLREFGSFFVLVMLSAGAVSLMLFIGCTGMKEPMLRLARYARESAFCGRLLPYRTGETASDFHFSVPVFMGAVLYAGGITIL